MKYENDVEMDKNITGMKNELITRKCQMADDKDGNPLPVDNCVIIDTLKRRVGLCPKTKNRIKNSLVFVGLIYGITFLTAGPFAEFVTLQQKANDANTVKAMTQQEITRQWEDALLRGGFYAIFPTAAALLAEWLKNR